MLLKLIKYDLKYIFKAASIFAIIFLASIVFYNLTGYDIITITEGQGESLKIVGETYSRPAIFLVLHGLFYNIIYISLVGLILIAIIRIWQRFKTNFYSDEAYLTHTLPVSRNTLWAAKVCSAFLTIISIILIATIGGLILSLARDGLQLLQSLGMVTGCASCIRKYYHVEPQNISFYLIFASLILTQLMFTVLCGFTGIILGYRTNIHQGIRSLLTGFTIYILAAVILLFSIDNLFPIFDSKMSHLTTTIHGNTAAGHYGPNFVSRTLVYIGLTYVCFSAILYFVDQKVLKRSINLD